MSPIEASPTIPFTHAPSLSRLTISPSEFLQRHPHVKEFMTGTLVFQSQSRNATALNEHEDKEEEEEPKILLLRRAPTDSYPLSWELPGGSVDASDVSVLSAAARELWEETSLPVSHFKSCLGLLPSTIRPPAPEAQEWGIPPGKEPEPLEETIFSDEQRGKDNEIRLLTFTETDQAWGKITLVAQVRDTRGVKIRPEEHVESAWVTEREVLTGWLDAGNGHGHGHGEEGMKGERRVLGFLSPAVRSQALEAFRLRREGRV